MIDKKVAHIVIVEMIDEEVRTILAYLDDPNPNCYKPEVESIFVIQKVLIINRLVQILARMTMQPEEMTWVVDQLHKIKEKLPPEYQEKLLPVKLLVELNRLIWRDV
jgi:hypothetical protein